MNKLLAISFCAMLLATACESSEEQKAQAAVKKVEAVQPAAVVEQKVATITTIDWQKALDMHKAGAVLIDVRTPAEVAKGMAAATAINIPLQEMPSCVWTSLLPCAPFRFRPRSPIPEM